jgi:hypothetical protein
MLTEIADVPSGVIGFEVSGKIRGEDYQDVLLPALRDAAATGELRIVIVIPEFEGLEGGAFWQDAKAGLENWGAWKRIALVTDVEWMKHGTDWFGWMSPGQVKYFPLAERAEAIAWAAS